MTHTATGPTWMAKGTRPVRSSSCSRVAAIDAVTAMAVHRRDPLSICVCSPSQITIGIKRASWRGINQSLMVP